MLKKQIAIIASLLASSISYGIDRAMAEKWATLGFICEIDPDRGVVLKEFLALASQELEKRQAALEAVVRENEPETIVDYMITSTPFTGDIQALRAIYQQKLIDADQLEPSLARGVALDFFACLNTQLAKPDAYGNQAGIQKCGNALINKKDRTLKVIKFTIK